MAKWNVKRIATIAPDYAFGRDVMGGYVSGCKQQMLTIARTPMANPELLLEKGTVRFTRPSSTLRDDKTLANRLLAL